MNEPRRIPRAILLATDLSARCDRALDRAVLLARQWQADLVALHVVEREYDYPMPGTVTVPSWRRPEDPVALAEWELRSHLLQDEMPVEVLVEEGVPDQVIARVAIERGCGLIVTGLARDETLGRFSLGTTVERLVRRSNVPVLIVKNRARSAYRNVVVATDFSEPSRRALDAAVALFPSGRLTVFHAYETPISRVVGDRENYRRVYRKVVAAEAEEFLAAADLPRDIRRALATRFEEGAAAPLLREFARTLGVDLVVLGTRGRNAILGLLIGSAAREILEALPCDALMVREPLPAGEDEPPANAGAAPPVG